MDTPSLTLESTERAPGVFHAAPGSANHGQEPRVDCKESSGLVGVGGVRPYYAEGGIQIFHANAYQLLPFIPREAAIISDPPYGIAHVKGTGGKGKHSRRNISPIHGDDRPFDPRVWLAWENVLLWGADHFAPMLPEGRWLTWDKLDGLASYDSFSDVEVAWHSRRGATRIFRYLWKGICQAGDKAGGRDHPTQKPEPLMRWCIEQAGKPALICDPYMGVGTTLRAAKELGLSAIGIEVEERYCEAAARRLSQGILSLGGGGAEHGDEKGEQQSGAGSPSHLLCESPENPNETRH